MTRVHIVTDSMCQIPSALCQELEIHVVPLPFVWDDRSYLDDEIGPREFYSRLRTSESLPKTSGPTPGAFKEEFEALAADGEPVLAIVVGREFSSTLDAASLAKDMSPRAQVKVFDSDSNSMGLGFQVLAAARAAREGKDLDEILRILDRVKKTCGVVFAVTDLSYLRRGGRISHLSQLFASALSLVPILELRGGPIKLVERVRQEKWVMPRMLELVAERLPDERPVRIAVVHADAEANAWELAKAVRRRFDPDELITSELTPVLGTHTGPGAYGLAYACGI